MDEKRPKRKSFYQDYFDQYEEIQALKPDGSGIEIRRVYVGDYYVQDLSLARKILVRVLYVALYLGAVALYWLGASARVGSNLMWYVVLPQAVAIPFVFWIGWTFLNYIPAMGKMKDWDYRHSTIPLRRASLWATIALTAAALLEALWAALQWRSGGLQALICGACFAGAALLLFLLHWIEGKITYQVQENENQIEDFGQPLE